MGKTPAKKSAKKGARKARAAPRRKRTESFAVYIYRVLKQVHPETGISKKSMVILNNFVMDTFDKLAAEASSLAHTNNRDTLSGRDVQSAIRLVLPGDLSQHALSEASKAMTKYMEK